MQILRITSMFLAKNAYLEIAYKWFNTTRDLNLRFRENYRNRSNKKNPIYVAKI